MLNGFYSKRCYFQTAMLSLMSSSSADSVLGWVISKSSVEVHISWRSGLCVSVLASTAATTLVWVETSSLFITVCVSESSVKTTF